MELSKETINQAHLDSIEWDLERNRIINLYIGNVPWQKMPTFKEMFGYEIILDDNSLWGVRLIGERFK
jgi:hypothetical protein